MQALQSAGFDPVLELPAQPLQHLDSQTLYTLLQRHKQQQQQQYPAVAPAASSGAASTQPIERQADCMGVDEVLGSGSASSNAARAGVTGQMVSAGVVGAVAPEFLSIDIACVVPQHAVKLMQEQGFRAAVTALQQQQQQQQGVIGPPQDTAAAAAAAVAGHGARPSLLDAERSLGDGRALWKAGCEGVAVAVEVDGPTHVAVNGVDHMLGATVCRNWLLQQWGWTVVVVPWWEWQTD
jgi:hypothetical protein